MSDKVNMSGGVESLLLVLKSADIGVALAALYKRNFPDRSRVTS